MLNFGKTKPTTMEFTLGDSEQVHSLPLGASIPFDLRVKLAEAMAEPDDARREYLTECFQMELMRRYIDAEAVEALTMEHVQEIYAAWLEESAKNGATPGE
jgi:hypothetical protein